MNILTRANWSNLVMGLCQVKYRVVKLIHGYMRRLKTFSIKSATPKSWELHFLILYVIQKCYWHQKRFILMHYGNTRCAFLFLNVCEQGDNVISMGVQMQYHIARSDMYVNINYQNRLLLHESVKFFRKESPGKNIAYSAISLNWACVYNMLLQSELNNSLPIHLQPYFNRDPFGSHWYHIPNAVKACINAPGLRC